MSRPSKIYHLLKPREYRVWCRPDKPPGDLQVTNKPSKATCANCLTAFRSKTQSRYSPFRVTHTDRELEPDPFAEWKRNE